MDLSALLQACFRAAVAAVEPRAAVARALDGRLTPPPGRIVVLALGKAAGAMAWGVADAVPGELSGVAVADQPRALPPGITGFVGDHPMPSEASVAGGEALLAAAKHTGPDDLAVVLVSGGGSALAEAPVPGITLSELRRTTEVLLRSGAPIEEINAVRGHLSRLKGGGLAAALAGVPSLTLVVSDVVGDRLDIIASGPMTLPSTSPDTALTVLSSRRLLDVVPSAIVAALGGGAAVPRADGDEIEIVASGVDAADAARDRAMTAVGSAEVIDTGLTGEAAPTATRLVTTAHRPAIAVYAGETTVTVTGDGRGGRNHEAALAASIAIDGDEHTVFLAAGTDGVDGAADGAGAVVDGTTAATARRLGVDPSQHLAHNDSGGFFDQVPGRIVTGPTGTNVGDVWLVGRS